MIVSVWGSYGSGKTLLSTKIGSILAKAGKKTLIIYSNIMSNDTSCIYPDEKDFVSMGDLWQMDIDDDEIYEYMMTTKYDNLAYLSYAPGENIYSYPVFTKYNIVSLLTRLGTMFDHIIIDCSSDLNASVITLTALEMSDITIRLIGATGKDYLYFLSNLTLISDSRFNLEKHISILSNIKKGEPENVYEMKYGDISYKLYHDESVYKSYLSGGALDVGRTPLEREIERITMENIEVLKKVKKEKKVRKEKKDIEKKINKEPEREEKKTSEKEKKSGGIGAMINGLFSKNKEESYGKYDE